MSKISGKSREKLHSFGDHHKFLSRIRKTLYYGKLPKTDRLSLPVTELASELFSEAKTNTSIERLHCNDAAVISRNACVSPCSLVLALLYLDRLKSCNPDYLQRVGPSELFLVSLMVSSKFLYDDGEEDEVCLSNWAESGGVSAAELISLEKDFLNAIQWKVFVGEPAFWKKLNHIETTIAKREGFRRGWLTYSELENLMAVIDVQNLIQCLVAFSAILITAYTAGILTIVGSMYILSNIPGNCLRSTSYTSHLEQDVANSSYYMPLEDIKEEIKASCDINLLPNIRSNDNVVDDRYNYKKPIDAGDVLKTGIILASIKSVYNSETDCNRSCFDYEEEDDADVEYISWDWWTSSALVWLAKSSKIVENLNFIPQYTIFKYGQYMDKCIASCKKLDLEDQVHKGTKLRIQDQLESSWHKEWTDTVTSALFNYRPFSYYFQKANLKNI